MSSDSSRRRYDASHRQAQARANRGAMIAAARDRFLGQGYAATTIADVAGDAGVSVPTVYKAFGNKGGLLKAVFDVTVAGDDEPIPIPERDFIQAIIQEPDAATKIARYLEHLAETMPRTAPIHLLARDAGASDPDAAEVFEQVRAEMLEGMTMFAATLEATGELAVSADEARDILWALTGPEQFELLVLARGWPLERYRDFITRRLVDALLG
jgi:AcrR family transcriptional regulator